MLSFILWYIALGISVFFLLTTLIVILVVSIKGRELFPAIFAVVVFIVFILFISASVLGMLGM
ncbi:hypothetical protein VL10_ORF03 [Staphylococcus phage vB_SauM_VL10]|nr:hypothetical protein VL10_ORF03 [Staphylococcus phage vB_SauM_VL10]